MIKFVASLHLENCHQSKKIQTHYTMCALKLCLILRVECSALLDHSYHSVLSTQDDIPISTVLADAAYNKRLVQF